MSHFTTVKTRLVAREELIAALQDVAKEFGLGRIRERAKVHGWSDHETQADIVVSTSNPGYDLGFVKKGRTYSLVADWYGIHDIDKTRLERRLEQRYAYHVTRNELEEKGFTLTEEDVAEDQSIRMVVRRMV
jgi:hypothetical protein